MKFSAIFFALSVLLVQSVSAHYIFNTLVFGNQTSAAAVRKPQNNLPIPSVASPDMRCNTHAFPATETVTVSAGSTIGFKLDAAIFHQGPAAIYLGKAPGSAASWDGSGANWFKIAEWGAHFSPFGFDALGKTELMTTIPEDTPSGPHLVRIEHIALHNIPGEYYVSCAQINIIDGGSGNPSMVSIPGYIETDDESVNLDIYWPVPTSYKTPGPIVWRG